MTIAIDTRWVQNDFLRKTGVNKANPLCFHLVVDAKKLRHFPRWIINHKKSNPSNLIKKKHFSRKSGGILFVCCKAEYKEENKLKNKKVFFIVGFLCFKWIFPSTVFISSRKKGRKEKGIGEITYNICSLK